MRNCTCLHFALFVSLLTISGCENRLSQTTAPALPSTALSNDGKAAIDRVFEIHDVKPDELTLTSKEVEQRLGVAQKWTEFSINEIKPGQYEGKAKSPKGEVLNVEIRQTANGIYSRWTNSDGDGFGYASIVW